MFSNLNWWISSNRNSYTSCYFSCLFQFFMIVLDWFDSTDLHYLYSFLWVFWILLFIKSERCSDSNWTVLDINSEYYWIILSKNSNCFKNTRENGLFSFFNFSLFSNLWNILGKIIGQMIDDIGCKDLNLIFFSVFLCILKNFYIKNQHACKSKINSILLFFSALGDLR